MIKTIWIHLLTRFSRRLRLRPQAHRSGAARLANIEEHEYRRRLNESIDVRDYGTVSEQAKP